MAYHQAIYSVALYLANFINIQQLQNKIRFCIYFRRKLFRLFQSQGVQLLLLLQGASWSRVLSYA